ncbi:MAG: hypothetical protein AB7K09_12235 [Planctomycetota bacterium]
MPDPTHTLVLITAGRLVRADATGSGLRMVEANRPAANVDLAQLVGSTLRLGTTKPRQVWVLCSDVFSQQLDLQGADNLSEDELRTVLGFEAEALSGLPAAEATLACVQLPFGEPGTRTWRVAQMLTSELDAIAAAVLAAGGRLAGVLHPAAVPARIPPAPSDPVDADPDDAWQRIELWPDCMALLHGVPEKPLRVEFLYADPLRASWREAFQPVFEALGEPPRDVLAGADTLDPALHPSSFSLQRNLLIERDTSARSEWLSLWSAVLLADPDSVPVLKAVRRPAVTRRTTVVTAVVLQLLALIVCGWHWHNLSVADLPPAVTTGKPDTRQLTALRTEQRKLEGTIASLTNRESRLKQIATDELTQLTIFRQRIPGLLADLAELAHDDVYIGRVSIDSLSVDVNGYALYAAGADRLAQELARRHPELDVQAPRKTAAQQQGDGGPYQFELHLEARPPTIAPRDATQAHSASSREEAQ